MRGLARHALGAAAAALVALSSSARAAPGADDPKRLQPGVFLYAVPGMGDPNFAQAVVLLVTHHAGLGSMGLVVNRPTLVPLRELLSLPEALGSELCFHWGGPVEPRAVHALVRTGWPSESARRVVGDVFITTDSSDLRGALARSDARTKVKLFSGYAGWGKGQLEAEVRAGAWVIEPADARSVFAPDGTRLWERVYSILARLAA